MDIFLSIFVQSMFVANMMNGIVEKGRLLPEFIEMTP
jgi:hypothetical protein